MTDESPDRPLLTSLGSVAIAPVVGLVGGLTKKIY